MAYIITYGEPTESRIRVRLTDLDTGWSNGTRYCYWYISDSGYPDPDTDDYYRRTSLSDGAEESGTVSFTGLDPDTKYYIVCDVWRTDTDRRITYFRHTEYTAEPEILVDYWSWTSSNGSATSAQTKKAYTAITSKGKLTDFSYLVWNDMVDKAVEILNASGKTWLTKNENTGATYTTAANTKMTSSDRRMTALRFNSLKFQIGNKIGTGTTNYPSGIQDVERGDKILGEYFVIFGSKFNDWIDKVL